MHRQLYLVLIIILALPGLVNACMCGRDSQDNSQAFTYYDHIFIAKITEAKLVPFPKKRGFKMDRFIAPMVDETIKASFSVEKVFKGDPSIISNIEALPIRYSCGMPVHIGSRYLIFAKSNNAHLGLCGRSRMIGNLKPIEQIKIDRKELKWLDEASNK
ncbi:MAG: hypothetical protein GY931_21985 [Maribacter sp.]|nr:hypothetical protein [Maribacter sp.]